MKASGTKVDRRKFLAGVAVAGATAASATNAKAAPTTADGGRLPSALPPTAHEIAIETGAVDHASGGKSHGRPGSDFMVDVIKSLKIDYVYSNPASSFRGLHESLINYGKNSMPEFITCMHEESSAAMCHGYFKATGKPQMILCHGTVGLMHASMAVYNAWCDRVPLMILGGNDADAAKRPPGVPTYHSAQDIGVLVRDYTKWDDAPVSQQHFAQSFVRAYKAMMTPPYGPVLLSLDAGIQDTPVDPGVFIPKYTAPSPAQADVSALRETAKLLANAERPVIVVDRMARDQEGVNNLVTLAELLQVPVVDQGGRMNMPNRHYLNQSQGGQSLIRNADVILGLECSDFWNTVNQWIDNGENHGHGLQEKRMKPDAKLITISGVDLLTKSNFQDFQRYQPVDIAMAGDSQTSLPALIEAVRAAIPASKKDAFEKRGATMKEAWQKDRDRLRTQAGVAWDASPINTARVAAETWAAIKDQDWSLVQGGNIRQWAARIFDMDKHYRFLGTSGGSGLGYGLPASIGAAHGGKALGRFSVSFQGDGDMMYAPGALWTAAHHEIPLLTIMHNNRGYHQEVMHVQRLSNRRNRVANLGKTMGPVGCCIENPDIDYAGLAKSMGVWAMGPITDPKELGPALKKAVDVVKSGQPALLDTVTQPR